MDRWQMRADDSADQGNQKNETKHVSCCEQSVLSVYT